MKPTVYIRPLVLKDAKTSYRWRNDPDIWTYTESKPDRIISPEIEEEWLKGKLSKVGEIRFAICLEENDQYIGNIQLLDIDDDKATYHIFIGEKSFWGKGISQSATKLILTYAFSELNLEKVLLEVNPLNVPAWKAYQKIGFAAVGRNKENGFMKMTIGKNEFQNKSY